MPLITWRKKKKRNNIIFTIELHQMKPFDKWLTLWLDHYWHDGMGWNEEIGTHVGDKEWYFFCIRGRKYRNSVRPNRVTGSGFWKATGIDKPVYSTGGETHHCIGLKKSLVYYRGSAGKGTKTDWMMHEFRLPPKLSDKNNNICQEAVSAYIILLTLMPNSNSILVFKP